MVREADARAGLVLGKASASEVLVDGWNGDFAAIADDAVCRDLLRVISAEV
jgi:hypothetical protein